MKLLLLPTLNCACPRSREFRRLLSGLDGGSGKRAGSGLSSGRLIRSGARLSGPLGTYASADAETGGQSTSIEADTLPDSGLGGGALDGTLGMITAFASSTVGVGDAVVRPPSSAPFAVLAGDDLTSSILFTVVAGEDCFNLGLPSAAPEVLEVSIFSILNALAICNLCEGDGIVLLVDRLCLPFPAVLDFGDVRDLTVLGVPTVSPIACSRRTASSRAFSSDVGVPVLILLPAVTLTLALTFFVIGTSILETTLGCGVFVVTNVTSLTLLCFVLRICSWP